METRAAAHLSFSCSHCGHENQVPAELAGRKGRCGRCREVTRVPGSRAERVLARPEPVMARREPEPELARDPSYEEWIGDVIKRPFGSGAAAGLSLSTLVTLGLLFAVFARPFFANLPAGRYPNIVLAAPFLIGAGLVFLLLSPAFYALRPRPALVRR